MLLVEFPRGCTPHRGELLENNQITATLRFRDRGEDTTPWGRTGALGHWSQKPNAGSIEEVV